MKIQFKPEADHFADAASEYDEIWQREGDKVVAKLNDSTGLPEPADFDAIVYEGISNSGDEKTPMRLRASYPSNTKLGTLIHELGHRYLIGLKRRPHDLDEHRLLFLFLYDVWADLYGEDFAEEMVAIESRRRGNYDYECAWRNSLILTKEERREKYQQIKALN